MIQPLLVWGPLSAEQPASNFGTLDLRNQHPVVDLEPGESVLFSGVLPSSYAGGGLDIRMTFAMSSATTGNVQLTTHIERIGTGQQDLDSNGWATGQQSGDVAVPGTSGLTSIAQTLHDSGAEMDSLAAGEAFRLKVLRDDAESSEAAGDLELVAVEMREQS